MANKKLTKKERYEIKKQEKLEGLKKLEQKQKAKRFLFWGVALLVIGLSIWGIANWAMRTAPDYENKTVQEVAQTDWTKGNPQAPVTLIEYSDFQCPACASFFPVVKQLLEDYPDEVRFVYRHFPLRSIHAKAQLAGQAAEAAGLQDMFWEMHDMLFIRQSEWSSGNHKDLFIAYAQELGLDVDKFKEDLGSSFTKDRVDQDFISAQQANLSSTPSFFVNGNYIQNPRTYEEFKDMIDALLTE